MAKRRSFHKKPQPKFNYRTNDGINVPKIRLVGDNFAEISEAAGRTIESGVFNTREAIKWAEEMEMDLIEISPKADPPVAKIEDYNKFLYLKKKKEKEIKTKTVKTVIKEIRFGPNTCLLYTSPSPRDKRQSRMPSSA